MKQCNNTDTAEKNRYVEAVLLMCSYKLELEQFVAHSMYYCTKGACNNNVVMRVLKLF